MPILRIFDVEKAREFYLGFLGLTSRGETKLIKAKAYRFNGLGIEKFEPGGIAA